MKKFLQIFTLLFFCFCATIAPLVVAIVEYYCPMFKPESVMVYERKEGKGYEWVERLESNDYLKTSLVIFEIGCFCSCVGVLTVLDKE